MTDKITIIKWKFSIGNKIVNKKTGDKHTIKGIDRNKKAYIVKELSSRIDKEEIEEDYKLFTFGSIFDNL